MFVNISNFSNKFQISINTMIFHIFNNIRIIMFQIYDFIEKFDLIYFVDLFAKSTIHNIVIICFRIRNNRNSSTNVIYLSK